MSVTPPQPGGSAPDPGLGQAELTRRGFLRKGAAVAAGGAALAAALSPLRELGSDDVPTVAQLLQKHYKEMTPEDKQAVFARIAHEVEQRYHVQPHLTDPPPLKMPA